MEVRSYEWYRDLFGRVAKQPDHTMNLDDCAELLKSYRLDVGLQEEEKRAYALKVSNYMKRWAAYMAKKTLNGEYDQLYWKYVLFEAPELFDSYLRYMEKDRPSQRKFYEPRRKTLEVCVNDLQDLEDRKLDMLGISLPPRVGKSTMCIFFMSWIMGKRPNSHNAMSGHSGILADGFYNETLNLLTTSEYHFGEIFPEAKMEKKSADKKEITLGDPDRFATLTCRGIDGTWTGSVDISSDGYLYVDDLVRDRTESLSPTRLENKYQDYLNVLVDRKNDGARELMVGTLWNIADPLSRVENEKKGNPRYRFRKIPALNDNDESNFDYDYGVGFSTNYYIDLRSRLDKNEWEAKYQQRPFAREGLLFEQESLRYFYGVLPETGFVRAISAADIAWGGGDSTSMPIGYEYENGDVYIVDWVFNAGTKEETLPLVSQKIIDNKIQQINCEANNGGNMYAQYLEEMLIERNYKCSVTSTKAPSTMSKMAKIIQYSGDIKRRFVFLAPNRDIDKQAEDDKRSGSAVTRYKRSKEYNDAMEELCMTVQIGKNLHDDACDSLAQLESYLEDGWSASTVVGRRIF